MQILVVSCSLNPGSRSRTLAELVAGDLSELGAMVDFRDLRDSDLLLCGSGEAYAAPGLAPLVEAIGAADAILLGAPIYNFDLSATAKNLVELTGRHWTGKVVGFLCAAGGSHAYMAPLQLANSLMLDFRCQIVPRFVYAAKNAFAEGGNTLIDEDVRERVRQLAAATWRLTAALLAHDAATAGSDAAAS